MPLDELDRQILEQLQADARQSARAISRRLHVAAGTVTQRIAKLEAAGVITGYSVTLDEARLGRSLAFVVGLHINQGQEMSVALDELAAFPEVEEVLVVTGRWDLLVIGRVGDPAELNELLTRGLWQSPLFRHSETMLVIDRRSERRHQSSTSPPAGDRER
jgi:DNA-binding Lrp family transcriptional regulator